MLPVQQMLLGSGANHPASGGRFPDTGPGWSMVAGSLGGNGTMNAILPNNDGQFAVGTGDFCVEWWMWMDPGSRPYGRQWQIGTWPSPFGVSIEGNGPNRTFYFWGSNQAIIAFPMTDFEYSRWHHWCVERVGGWTRVYRDGLLLTQTLASYNVTTTASMGFMSEGNYASAMAGFIADWHFVKGNFKYGSEFTPPTTSIQPMTGTTYLLNALTSASAITDSSTLNNTMVDNSVYWSPRGPYLAPNLWLDGSTDSYPGSGFTWHNLGRDDYVAQLNSQMGVVNGAMNFNDNWGNVGAYAQLTGGTHPILANLTNGISVVAVYEFTGENNYERIIDFGSGAAAHNIIMCRVSTSDDLAFAVYDASNNEIRATVTGAATPGGVGVAVGTNSVATSLQLSTPGSTINTTGVAIPPGVRSNCFIGRSNWNGDAYLHGGIFHLSIFDRVLTTDEINQVKSIMAAKYGI